MTEIEQGQYRAAQAGDLASLAELRCRLWMTKTLKMSESETRLILSNGGSHVLIVAHELEGQLVGYAEVSVRSSVSAGRMLSGDGCLSLLAHLEGWYVDPRYQCGGIGRELVARAARWAAGQGARVMGSNVDVENETGQRAHASAGFQQLGTSVYYQLSTEAAD